MNTEVVYPDGSMSTFHEGGGSSHDGGLAIERLRLISARMALSINLTYGYELTRHGSYMAVMNVIAPLTGENYLTPRGRLTKKGKALALAHCQLLIDELEASVVIYEEAEPTCDICGVGQYHSEHLAWNGETGNHVVCEGGE